MTSTWQTPRTEMTLNYDVVESLEYRPIMLSEDISEDVGAREDEDFSEIKEDQHQELGTSCQSSLVSSRRIEEGLPFECPLLLIDNVSLRNTNGSVNSTSTKPVLIEGEKRCTSEKYYNSSLQRCNNLLAAEIEAVDIQVPLEGAIQPQQETIDDLPLLVDGNHNPENIVELISDAMEGCYVSASNDQSCETAPLCQIEQECWDAQPINCDLSTDVRSTETSRHPEGDEDEEDIVILARESLHTQDEFPVYAIQEDSEVSLLSNNDEHSITLSTLADKQNENKPRATSCPDPENDRDQIRLSDKPSVPKFNAQSYRDNCRLEGEERNPSTPSGRQWTVQWDAEEEVDDVKGTCLDIKTFRPVYTTANKPASHGTPFIESLAPPMRLSFHQAPRIEARGYHSEGHIEETERDHAVYTSSSESTTSSAAFVIAMNLRNRQKSNIFKSPISIPMPPSKDGVNDLGAVFKSGEAKQDSSLKHHRDFLEESLHSDEKTLSQMNEMLPCTDSNRADDVDVEGTNGGPVSPDQTDALITPEITKHPPPDSGDGSNLRNEDRLDFGRRWLEDSNDIIRPDQSDGQDQHIISKSKDITNNDQGSHCVQNTSCQKISSTVCNIPPQMKFGVLQTPRTEPLDVEDKVNIESGQVAKDHQTHPQMSPRPFDHPGHLPRHDNNLTRVGGARSPSRKVERLRRRELYRMTREVMLQKERWERMHQDALRSVDEFNLVRQEVVRLYNRLDNNQTKLFSDTS